MRSANPIGAHCADVARVYGLGRHNIDAASEISKQKSELVKYKAEQQNKKSNNKTKIGQRKDGKTRRRRSENEL